MHQSELRFGKIAENIIINIELILCLHHHFEQKQLTNSKLVLMLKAPERLFVKLNAIFFFSFYEN